MILMKSHVVPKVCSSRDRTNPTKAEVVCKSPSVSRVSSFTNRLSTVSVSINNHVHQFHEPSLQLPHLPLHFLPATATTAPIRVPNIRQQKPAVHPSPRTTCTTQRAYGGHGESGPYDRRAGGLCEGFRGLVGWSVSLLTVRFCFRR